jgi:hypothetical protein
VPTYPLYLSCADPGVTTGLALLHATDTALELIETAADLYDPANYRTPLDTLKRWAGIPGRHHFVGEAFHIRPGLMIPDTTPERVIDHIKIWIRDYRPYGEVIWHEPVGGKTMITDEVLKKMGLLVRGKDSNHMKDALRHGVTHLFNRRHRPTCRRAFPPRVRAGR